MNAIFLLTPSKRPLDLVAHRLGEGGLSVEEVSSGRLRVGDGDDHVFVFLEQDAREVPEGFRNLLGTVASKAAVVIEYSSLPLLRRVLDDIADDAGLSVDNDHGTLLSGPLFLHRLGWH